MNADPDLSTVVHVGKRTSRILREVLGIRDVPTLASQPVGDLYPRLKQHLRSVTREQVADIVADARARSQAIPGAEGAERSGWHTYAELGVTFEWRQVDGRYQERVTAALEGDPPRESGALRGDELPRLAHWILSQLRAVASGASQPGSGASQPGRDSSSTDGTERPDRDGGFVETAPPSEAVRQLPSRAHPYGTTAEAPSAEPEGDVAHIETVTLEAGDRRVTTRAGEQKPASAAAFEASRAPSARVRVAGLAAAGVRGLRLLARIHALDLAHRRRALVGAGEAAGQNAGDSVELAIGSLDLAPGRYRLTVLAGPEGRPPDMFENLPEIEIASTAEVNR